MTLAAEKEEQQKQQKEGQEEYIQNWSKNHPKQYKHVTSNSLALQSSCLSSFVSSSIITKMKKTYTRKKLLSGFFHQLNDLFASPSKKKKKSLSKWTPIYIRLRETSLALYEQGQELPIPQESQQQRDNNISSRRSKEETEMPPPTCGVPLAEFDFVSSLYSNDDSNNSNSSLIVLNRTNDLEFTMSGLMEILSSAAMTRSNKNNNSNNSHHHPTPHSLQPRHTLIFRGQTKEDVTLWMAHFQRTIDDCTCTLATARRTFSQGYHIDDIQDGDSDINPHGGSRTRGIIPNETKKDGGEDDTEDILLSSLQSPRAAGRGGVISKNSNSNCFFEESFEEMDAYEKFHKKYELFKQHPMGEGTFSIVRRGRNRWTGLPVAIKVSKSTALLAEEVKMMKTIQQPDEDNNKDPQFHPYLISLLDVYQCPEVSYIVMECMQTDLCDRMITLGTRMSEDNAKRILYKLVLAMDFFHSKHIVHRDIKPENILLNETNSAVKIADWGLAKQLGSPSEKLNKTAGTPEYAAPELLMGKPYGISCDVFSLGILSYVMLLNTFPFSLSCADALQHSLGAFSDQKDVRDMTCLYDSNASQWQFVTDLARDVLLKMLERDPEERITAHELIHHPWFASLKQSFSLEDAIREENDRKDKIQYDAFMELLTEEDEVAENGAGGRGGGGIVLRKHGRKGFKPHDSKIQLLKNGRTLTWQSKHRFLRPAPIFMGSREQFAPEDIELKNNCINVSDITDITPGLTTEVFARRQGQPRLLLQRQNSSSNNNYSASRCGGGHRTTNGCSLQDDFENRCFSILYNQNRTLDLETNDRNQRDVFVKNLTTWWKKGTTTTPMTTDESKEKEIDEELSSMINDGILDINITQN